MNTNTNTVALIGTIPGTQRAWSRTAERTFIEDPREGREGQLLEKMSVEVSSDLNGGLTKVFASMMNRVGPDAVSVMLSNEKVWMDASEDPDFNVESDPVRVFLVWWKPVDDAASVREEITEWKNRWVEFDLD